MREVGWRARWQRERGGEVRGLGEVWCRICGARCGSRLTWSVVVVRISPAVRVLPEFREEDVPSHWFETCLQQARQLSCWQEGCVVDVEVRSMSFAILRFEAIMTFLPREVNTLGLAPELAAEPNEAISKQADLILVFDIHFLFFTLLRFPEIRTYQQLKVSKVQINQNGHLNPIPSPYTPFINRVTCILTIPDIIRRSNDLRKLC